MKKTFKLFAIAAAALTAAACAQEVASPEEGLVADTFTAIIESKDTKTSINEDNYTVWTGGDAVTVFTNDFGAHKYELADGANTNAGTFAASSTAAQSKIAAIYPHNEANAYDGEKFTVQVPSEHQYVEGEISKAPMVGIFADGSVAFKNAGALIRVTATNIPAGFHTVTLTSENVNLSGEMTVVENNLTAGAYAEANNSVSITWTPVDKKTDMEFYFPIPVATFSKLTVTATDGTQTYIIKEKENFTSKRNTRYNMSYDADVFEIKDEAGLFWLAEQVAGGRTFEGQTVKLTADVTMTKDWTSIGIYNGGDPSLSFKGTFDGQNHTISGLKVTGNQCLGFFGVKYAGDVLNVKFDGAEIVGNHFGGVVVGWASGSKEKKQFKIDGCEVTNSTVTLAAELLGSSWDNGDKAGAIVGYAQLVVVSNNTVSKTTITGYRDIGGVVGTASNVYNSSYTTEVINNTLGNDVTVVVDNTHNYKNYTSSSSYNAKAYCGRNDFTEGGPENVIDKNTGEATIVTPQTIELSFDKDELTVILGDEFTAPTLTNSVEGVTYSSKDEYVATVDAKTGELTLKAAGTTVITASILETSTSFSASASYNLTVKPQRTARKLYFSSTEVTASLGDASFVPPTLGGVTDDVEYSSQNPTVATVDPTTGAITLKASGTTIITASAPQTDEYLEGTVKYTLTVKPVYLYVKNDMGWSNVNLYGWLDSDDSKKFNGDWPGHQLATLETINGNKFYKFTLPDEYVGKKVGIVFNNGTKQLSDYEAILTKDTYIRLTPGEPIVVDPNDKASFKYRIYVYDQNNKKDVNIHYWGIGSSSYPGVKITNYVDYDYKSLGYYEIPADAYNGVTFSYLLNVNGDESKTNDISVVNPASDFYIGYYNNAGGKGFWMNANEPFTSPDKM